MIATEGAILAAELSTHRQLFRR